MKMHEYICGPLTYSSWNKMKYSTENVQTTGKWDYSIQLRFSSIF